MIDPRCLRTEITLWCMDNLTTEERDAMTVAYGEVPGQLSPEILEGDCLCYVPAALRLPWEPAWQGESVAISA